MKTLEQKHILLVDDEPYLREILADEFVAQGARVSQASNVIEAWQLLTTTRFDAVISDLKMPGGDGLSLLKRIAAELTIKPRCFLCSAFHNFIAEEAKSAGVIEVFGKPFDESEILRIVAESLDTAD